MTESLRWPGRWFRVECVVESGRADVASALAGLGEGPGAELRPAGPGFVRVIAYCESLDAAQQAAARWNASGLVRGSVEGPRPVEDDGWLAASQAPRAPIRAGRFVILDRPSEVQPPDSLPLVLPPGRAFGTGEHPTTRACLELLSALDVEGAEVLDLGTGSGILAIGAALLGARRVVALDDDPRVIDVARDNARGNGVAGRIAAAAGSWTCLSAGARFDLLVANIHRTAICRAASALGPRLTGGCSRAVLSGFSPEDLEPVERAWRAVGFSVECSAGTGEWIAVRLRREEA